MKYHRAVWLLLCLIFSSSLFAKTKEKSSLKRFLNREREELSAVFEYDWTQYPYYLCGVTGVIGDLNLSAQVQRAEAPVGGTNGFSGNDVYYFIAEYEVDLGLVKALPSFTSVDSFQSQQYLAVLDFEKTFKWYQIHAGGYWFSGRWGVYTGATVPIKDFTLQIDYFSGTNNNNLAGLQATVSYKVNRYIRPYAGFSTGGDVFSSLWVNGTYLMGIELSL